MKLLTRRFWSSLLMTIVIAIGMNLAWGLLLTMLWLVASAKFFPTLWTQEHVAVDVRGVTSIGSYDPINYEIQYRNLDGTEIATPELHPNSAGLLNRNDPRFMVDDRMNWVERLVEFSDGRKFPESASWFAVQDFDARVYFEGFDDATKRPVGFISRQGHSLSIPPQEQMFQLPGKIAQDIVGLGKMQMPGWVKGFGESDLLPWGAYFLDEGKLMEVDLRRRTLRMIRDNCPRAAISYLSEVPQETVDRLKKDSEKVLKQIELHDKLALRTADQIWLIDPQTAETVRFKLPNSLLSADQISVYSFAGKELVLTAVDAMTSQARPIKIVRINSAGEVLSETVVNLDGNVPTSERTEAWKAAPAAPVPLLWGLALAIGTSSKVHFEHHPNYQLAFRNIVHSLWPPMVVVLFISLLAALYVYRTELRNQSRGNHRDYPLIWAITTFLLGPAMLVAYLVEHGRRVTTRCAACQAEVPAKRDKCAACGVELPAPAALGIEVFA